MKFTFPNKEKIYLPGNLSYMDRVKLVEDILAQYESYFNENWDSSKTRACLDFLANYLSRSDEFKNSNVLSTRKQQELETGEHKRYTLFSDLPKIHQALLGIIDDDDEIP